MNLFMQLIIGGAMIGVTVALHAFALDLIIHRASALAVRIKQRFYGWKPLITSLVVILVFGAHIVEIWLWAILYLVLEPVPLQNLPDALYFSTVTFTTVGYGDIVLGPSLRMLSAIEAANGFLLFGWTTAFIFELISKIYAYEAKGLH